jgi:uncharacterized protein YndB with AHSA1/START domain
MTDRNGTLTVEGDRAVLSFERRLPFPIEAVWSAITDPMERRQWMGETVIDPRQGRRHRDGADGSAATSGSEADDGTDVDAAPADVHPSDMRTCRELGRRVATVTQQLVAGRIATSAASFPAASSAAIR